MPILMGVSRKNTIVTSLSPTTVEALICTQSWLRSPSGPIDIIKSMEEIEAYEEIQEGIVV